MAAGSDDEHRKGANEMSQEMKKSHNMNLPAKMESPSLMEYMRCMKAFMKKPWR